MNPSRKSVRIQGLKERPRAIHVSEQFKRLFYTSKPQAVERICGRTLELVHRTPNIYACDEFLTESELSYIAQYYSQHHDEFQRSFTQDLENEELVYDECRTSTYTHLPKCGSTVIRNIERRAADCVGLPHENVEPLQLLSYAPGQYFDIHHDAGRLEGDVDAVGLKLPGAASGGRSREDFQDSPPDIRVVMPDAFAEEPRRILTAFVYLTSLPDSAGGETDFPLINQRFHPRRGRALFWSNLFPDGTADPRVVHQARPTLDGHRKMGMNVWITDTPQTALVGTVSQPSRQEHGTHTTVRACSLSQAHRPISAGERVCCVCYGLLAARKSRSLPPSAARKGPAKAALECRSDGCMQGIHVSCAERAGRGGESSILCWRCGDALVAMQ
ncbi:unnamed protein product [Vitrella brassicaformis CCMP3155]|uniref:Prolyl 4-hydroxylase alpha subunit domain-containing protein n=1 Tax=Vitrella brassicaformis (strain CCMP3155) TaxID=1169540 RepID=A0A0G4EJU6_VITBC|nr:unnamed protein product [Vitrella brassicaformis CCMP3155]|mmetsp:Transcript_28605/g.82487  ORF Transcript_28605/g.82487 Transcript_28605/m.82487 type:complete len:387 (+) Transcript_28605:14-1174(+)|eukprot:CEL97705.1 unnamed protein product [Vitrella brassicaformis CCMP3155]